MSIIKPYEIKEGEEVEVRIKGRFPYKQILEILFSGNTVFLPINRKQAHYLRRELEKRIDELVEASPVFYKGMEGYVFQFSMVQRFVEMIENKK